MRIGGRDFDTANGVYIMGILNVTPDSFSDGGRWIRPEAALRQAERMAREGAAIIDIGGDHRPATRRGRGGGGRRVLPVIEAVKRETGLPCQWTRIRRRRRGWRSRPGPTS